MSSSLLVYWMLIRTECVDSNEINGSRDVLRSWVGNDGFVTTVEMGGKVGSGDEK
jgi:hypothetical protein